MAKQKVGPPLSENPPVLLDLAALAVVRAPTARVEELNAPGSARLSRQRIKCPVAGCPITRSSQGLEAQCAGGQYLVILAQ